MEQKNEYFKNKRNLPQTILKFEARVILVIY